ncbi:MAG: hypothetical protein ACHQ9S_27080 [Candidatus Binatia bacterium]
MQSDTQSKRSSVPDDDDEPQLPVHPELDRATVREFQEAYRALEVKSEVDAAYGLEWVEHLIAVTCKRLNIPQTDANCQWLEDCLDLARLRNWWMDESLAGKS